MTPGDNAKILNRNLPCRVAICERSPGQTYREQHSGPRDPSPLPSQKRRLPGECWRMVDSLSISCNSGWKSTISRPMDMSSHRDRSSFPQSTAPSLAPEDFSSAFERAVLAAQNTDFPSSSEAIARLEALLSLPTHQRLFQASTDEHLHNPAVLEHLIARVTRRAQAASADLAELALLGLALSVYTGPDLPASLQSDYGAIFTTFYALSRIQDGCAVTAADALAQAQDLAEFGTGDPLVSALLLHVQGLLPGEKHAEQLLLAAAGIYRNLGEDRHHSWVLTSLLEVTGSPQGESASSAAHA